MKNLTEADTYSTPIEVPEGTDSRNNAAGHVESIAQRLANRTHHLNAHAAKKNVANVFTEAQAIDVLSCAASALRTDVSANDHPGSASNIWKPLWEGVANDGRRVRFYTGDGGNGDSYMVTWNALWAPASGAQTWSQDNGTSASSALWVRTEDLRWYGKAVGSSPWATGAWDAARGSVTIGANLTVNGNAQLPNLTGNPHSTGNLSASDDLIAGRDVKAGDDVVAVSEFQYENAHTRNTFVNMFHGWGEGEFRDDGGAAYVYLQGPGDKHCWPIDLPQGAVLQDVELICAKPGVGYSILRIRRKHAFDWNAVPAGPPTEVTIGSAASSNTEGLHTLKVSGLNFSIDNNGSMLFAEFEAGDANDNVFAMRLTWTDPGPRNH